MVAVPIRSSYLVANDTTQGTEKNQLEAYLENNMLHFEQMRHLKKSLMTFSELARTVIKSQYERSHILNLSPLFQRMTSPVSSLKSSLAQKKMLPQ